MEVCKMNQSEIEKIKLLSKKIRKNILDMSLYAGASSSHFGGALSSVEILATLFGGCATTQETSKECCKSEKACAK